MIGKKLVTCILIGLFGLTALGYLLSSNDPHHSLINDLLFLLAPFCSTLGGLYAARAYGRNNTHGLSFYLIAAGLASLFIGEVLFLNYEIILKTQAFPSLADVFYLLSYPLMLVGFLREVKNYKMKESSLDQVLLMIITVLLGFVVCYFGIYLAYQADESILNNTIAMAYGVGDLFLIAIALNILVLTFDFKGGKLFAAWLAICIGVFLTLVADILFAIYNMQFDQGIWLYRQIDLLWVGGYLSIAYGCFSVGHIIKEVQQKIRNKLKK